MKRIVLFMVMVSMVCIASYAQKAAEGTKVLVAYFSATGNTEKAAQQVASIVSGDLHKIQPEKSYTSADLNWRDKSSRSSVEMDDPTSRPAIIDDLKNLAEYDTVYLGFPIWWNQAPRLINTFLEKYNLSGKTAIPFATSGSSNISNAESELRKAYPDVNWQKGKLMNGATEEDIKKIADTYTAFVDGTLEDVKGFCAVADTAEIAKQDYILTPGRYVGIEEQEDDGEPFEDKMNRLTSELSEMFAKSHELEEEIRKNLGAIGYKI